MHSSWVYSITGISGYVVESQKLVRNGREREIEDTQKLILTCRETTELPNLLGAWPVELILALVGFILDDTARFAAHDTREAAEAQLPLRKELEEAQQQVDQEPRPDLPLDRVLVVPDEVVELARLLEFLEEQLPIFNRTKVTVYAENNSCHTANNGQWQVPQTQKATDNTTNKEPETPPQIAAEKFFLSLAKTVNAAEINPHIITLTDIRILAIAPLDSLNVSHRRAA